MKLEGVVVPVADVDKAFRTAALTAL